MSVHEFKVNTRGKVELQLDGETAEFVPESVAVWLAKGWKAVDSSNAVKNVEPLKDDEGDKANTVKVNVPEKKSKES